MTQDVAKANRDRENIRNELYRALQNVQLQNGVPEAGEVGQAKGTPPGSPHSTAPAWSN